MIIFLNNGLKEANCLIEETNSLYTSISGSLESWDYPT